MNEHRIIQVNDISIGDNIKHIREKAGYMQIDVVKQLQLSGYNISIFSYNRIEKGKQNPTVSLLLNLCNLFSCDINALFNWVASSND